MADDPEALLVRAISDPAASLARRAVCDALVPGFARLGAELRVSGALLGPGRVDGTSPFGNGDDRLVGAAYVAETAAELIRGVLALLDVGNLYGAMALNRQLVEVEYLAWAFADDHEEAANWLRSDQGERLKRWQPRHLRERSNGKFRGADYSRHCEMGGHPTPQGVRFIFNYDASNLSQITLYESVTHGMSAWRYFRDGLPALHPEGTLPTEEAARIRTAYLAWKDADQMWDALTEVTAGGS